MKFTPSSVTKRQFSVCITVTGFPYEIQSLYVGLVLIAILVVFIGKPSGSDSHTVTF